MRRTKAAKARRFPAIWSACAEQDLTTIYEYLHQRTHVGTRTVIEGILSAVAGLEEVPLLGVHAELVEPEGDLRQFPWRHYVIFYRVRPENVLILRIWDSRREPDALRLPADPTR